MRRLFFLGREAPNTLLSICPEDTYVAKNIQDSLPTWVTGAFNPHLTGTAGNHVESGTEKRFPCRGWIHFRIMF
jgi:hypothetical protein